MIKDSVKENELDRVVIACCSPRMHEITFQNAVEEGGMNPFCLEIANIREHCSWVHSKEPEKATAKARKLVKIAVAKARLLDPLDKSFLKVTKSALVIGGGIAGIQTALDIADQGIKVYLVESSPSIGGRMAQLDKTFPTLDCSACILTPKMMEVGNHPKIELLSYSEVDDVSGNPGNFEVKVRKKSRFVKEDLCVGCGLCAEECRLAGKVTDDFNMGMGKRSAIYVPFPQAVPLKYTVDPEHCLFLTKGKCGKGPLCVEACDHDAIDFEMKDEFVEINVGSIIVATGFDLIDPEKMFEYGYSLSPNVITNLECERLLSASGPTQGKIIRPSDGAEPKSVTFILCVGSRDEQCSPFCCRIGCMSALKQGYLLKDHVGEDLEINICFNDIRAFGRGYEEFYRRVRGLKMNMIRGRPSEVNVLDDGGLYYEVYDEATKKLLEVKSDMIVLVPSLVPRAGIEDLANLLKLSLGADGFFLEAHPKLRPLDTTNTGIFIAGCCQAPKDIPDTVAQASGAAARACTLLSKDEVELDPRKSEVIDENCDGCAYCIDPCPYNALTLIEFMKNGQVKKTVDANEALCQGCGVCQATCPKEGIVVKGFKMEQLKEMANAALEEN
jgi:heterodisulfide reductase subunit A